MASRLVTRRRVIAGGAALGVVGVAATGVYVQRERRSMDAYDVAANDLRSPLGADIADRRDLIRYATLAANNHNAQPWKFRIGAGAVDVLPDLSRRTPVVDPDDHHLFCTLGCATENLILAAAARGLAGTATFMTGGEGGVQVSLETAAPGESAEFKAIPQRGVSRAVYDGKPVPASTVDALAAAGQSEAVDVVVITDPARVETILALVVEGNDAQFNDPAFMAELKSWIRFNPTQAIETGDGLFSGASGNPSTPAWLGRLMFGFVATPKSEADRAMAQIRSSAGVIVFVGREADPAHWVECGRSYQRFALRATTLGIRHAFINQAVEVPSVRERLAAELGMAGRRPDLIVRFGTGPAMPKSLRRPVASVLV